MILKSHKRLAAHIKNKKVLHLLSYGKDSIATLSWLDHFGIETVSLNLKFLAAHPDDERYLNYLKKKYPKITFIQFQDTQELNKFRAGVYQSPIERMVEFNKWEYMEFSFDELIEEMRIKYNCDFTCWGMSKYESVTRATSFYRKGLLQDTKIFPLGLMTKEQVITIAKQIKLHPVYKLCESTLDFPSWWRMRSTFIVKPEYYETMKKYFPLIELDRYRFEVLLEKK